MTDKKNQYFIESEKKNISILISNIHKNEKIYIHKILKVRHFVIWIQIEILAYQ